MELGHVAAGSFVFGARKRVPCSRKERETRFRLHVASQSVPSEDCVHKYGPCKRGPDCVCHSCPVFNLHHFRWLHARSSQKDIPDACSANVPRHPLLFSFFMLASGPARHAHVTFCAGVCVSYKRSPFIWSLPQPTSSSSLDPTQRRACCEKVVGFRRLSYCSSLWTTSTGAMDD